MAFVVEQNKNNLISAVCRHFKQISRCVVFLHQTLFFGQFLLASWCLHISSCLFLFTCFKNLTINKEFKLLVWKKSFLQNKGFFSVVSKATVLHQMVQVEHTSLFPICAYFEYYTRPADAQTRELVSGYIWIPSSKPKVFCPSCISVHWETFGQC